MTIDTITVHVQDGIKGAVDYSPNKEYALTAVLSNPSGDDLNNAVDVLVAAGERFLGRVPTTRTVTKPKTEKPEPPLAPAPAPQPESAASASDTASTTSSAEIDPLADLLDAPAPAAVKEIANEEIVHAVMRKNEALKDATKIRALVETFNPQPGLRVFKATEIDQKDRADFLAKLAELA